MMNAAARFHLVLAVALLAAGCSHPPVTDPSRRGPFFTPKNYIGEKELPDSIHRVVLLPVHAGDFAPPEEAEALDTVFVTALERQMRFEVVTLSRVECQASYGTPDISSAAALPHDFLQDLGRKYGADAVMFVDITAYQPYRPILLGIRAKLSLVSDHRLVWSFDQIFSASDPAIDNAVRRYYLDNGGGPMPLDMTTAALQSPTRFGAYAADAAFKTLPPR
jgi:hypothetical protein